MRIILLGKRKFIYYTQKGDYSRFKIFNQTHQALNKVLLGTQISLFPPLRLLLRLPETHEAKNSRAKSSDYSLKLIKSANVCPYAVKLFRSFCIGGPSVNIKTENNCQCMTLYFSERCHHIILYSRPTLFIGASHYGDHRK